MLARDNGSLPVALLIASDVDHVGRSLSAAIIPALRALIFRYCYCTIGVNCVQVKISSGGLVIYSLPAGWCADHTSALQRFLRP